MIDLSTIDDLARRLSNLVPPGMRGQSGEELRRHRAEQELREWRRGTEEHCRYERQWHAWPEGRTRLCHGASLAE